MNTAVWVGVTLVLVTGCSLETPKAPSWDTVLNIPVTDHRYSLTELLEGEENFAAGADSLLTFHFEQALDTTFVGDYLSLPDFHEDISVGLDAFVIPGVPVMADRFLWSQLTAEATSLDGTVAAVAPFSFNYLPSAAHSSEDLLYATLISGIARLHIYNRLNVDLENVILSLQNAATGGIVISSPLTSRIVAQDSALVDVDMRGATIPRQARWLISGNSPGSKGRQVAVNASLPVDVVLELRNFVISAAEARIPALTLQRTDTVWLAGAEGNAIDEAAFQSGRLILQLDNHSPFSSPTLSLAFPQIADPATGKSLAVHLSLQPAAVTRNEIDLTGMVADLPLPAAGSPQPIQVIISASTNDMRSTFIEVGAATSLALSVALENLRMDHFSGRLAPREVKLDSTVRALDISGEWGDLDGITLRQARLQVEIFSTLNLPLNFQGALYGFREGRAGSPFVLDIAVPPAAGAAGQLYKAPLFTANNSTIVDFINQQPDLIAATGTVKIGDSLYYGSVDSRDAVSARFSLDLPFELSWEARRIDGDVSSLAIAPPAEDRDPFEEEGGEVILSGEAMEHIRAAELALELENRLPLAGDVTFYFATDSTRLFDRPDLTLGPVTLAAAAVDASGKSTAPTTRTSLIALTNEQMALFRNQGDAPKNLYVSHRVSLAGSGGRSVSLYLPDYVRVQAHLRLTIRIGE
jgi:hypothetical protein